MRSAYSSTALNLFPPYLQNMSTELALAMSAQLDPARFEAVDNGSVQRILQTVREHLGAEIAFVGRYVDGNQRELMHVSTDLDLPMGTGFREPREDSFCWHVLEGRLPELIQDASDHPLAKTLPITKVLPVGCHLNVPLRLSDGSVFGSFCCVSREADRTVSERDMQVMRAFAQLASEQIERSIGGEEQAVQIGRKIDRVIEQRAIRPFEQPIHDLHSRRVVGFESLSRFEDADVRGPDKWFEDAKSVGRGIELELLAIEMALEAGAYLGDDVYQSINASPETVMSGKIAPLIAGFGKRNVVIELTEHEQVSDFAELRDALRTIAQHARIAVDDVGAGYAGLRFLVDLSPDLLKLDISLTRNIHKDLARQAMAKAIVHYAAAIGSAVIAEGIESREEMDMLTQLGVTYGQGYFFAAPMPFMAVSEYLREHR